MGGGYGGQRSHSSYYNTSGGAGNAPRKNSNYSGDRGNQPTYNEYRDDHNYRGNEYDDDEEGFGSKPYYNGGNDHYDHGG